jgi:hypothetical protein
MVAENEKKQEGVENKWITKERKNKHEQVT